jgi:hypothetical protein
MNEFFPIDKIVIVIIKLNCKGPVTDGFPNDRCLFGANINQIGLFAT